MKDEIITFETAKLAKEKEFNLVVYSYYRTSPGVDTVGLFNTHPYYEQSADNWNSKEYINAFSAPTQSLLQRWLREKHKIEVLIKYARPLVVGDPIRYEFYLYHDFDWYGHHTYETYELALEAGLQHALKLIKDERKTN